MFLATWAWPNPYSLDAFFDLFTVSSIVVCRLEEADAHEALLSRAVEPVCADLFLVLGACCVFIAFFWSESG